MANSGSHRDRMKELMALVEQIDGPTSYTTRSSRYSNEDGACLDASEVTWLRRLAPVAVAVRCATTDEARREALERLLVVVDELPMAMELRP